MKNTILWLCLLSSHVVLGQFVAGTKMLQGDFNLRAFANGNDKNAFNNFKRHYINAGIGAQIATIKSETRQWGFGGSLFLGNDVNKSEITSNSGISTTTNRTTGFSVGLNIFQTRLKKLLPNFYGGFRYTGGLGYSMQNYKSTNEQTSIVTQPTSTNYSDEQSTASINIGITSQFYYFITPKWGLSANIGYADVTLGRNFKDRVWSLNANSGFNGVGFGLFKILAH